MLDFGAWPPEVTSGQMYSGPGSGSMMVAASAWDGLSAQLASFANGYSSVISGLEGEHWAGPAATAMAAAAAPYVQWATTTGAQAEQAAGQARAAAAAFETAHAAVVPPPLVAANRTQLAHLIATNVLGQNTTRIAATEAAYEAMWAQNTHAMYGYAGSASSATKLSPFSQPPQTINPAGQSAQAAAAAAQTAGSGASQSQNLLSNVLQGLSTPGSAATSSGTTSLFGLPIPDSLLTSLGAINTIMGMPNAAGGAVRSVANVVGMVISLFRLGADTVLYAPLAGLTSATSSVGGLPTGVLAGAAESATGGVNRAVLASMGSAGPLGQLSVPPAWAQATPVAAVSEQPMWLSEVESWWEAGAPANLGTGTMAEVAAAAAAGTLLMRPVVGKALRVPPRRFKMSSPKSGG